MTPGKREDAAHEEFYSQLVSRNHHFFSAQIQQKLRTLKVVVAGCGSGGGACIEPLARAGVEHFWLADNGDYELPNLNRQRAFVENIGQNKAAYQEALLRRLNPYVDVRSEKQGITPENVEALVAWGDVILDGVDVTARPSIEMKVLLHETAKKLKKPVFSFLDLGYCQWGTSFDYRKSRVKTLNGRAAAALRARNPIKALFTMFPLSSVPFHSNQVVLDALEGRPVPISQLGIACDLLSAVVVASLVRFANDGFLNKGWLADVSDLAMPICQRFWERIRSFRIRLKIRRLLAKTL